MRAVVSRVAWARGVADGELTGETGPGLLILVGVVAVKLGDRSVVVRESVTP